MDVGTVQNSLGQTQKAADDERHGPDRLRSSLLQKPGKFSGTHLSAFIKEADNIIIFKMFFKPPGFQVFDLIAEPVLKSSGFGRLDDPARGEPADPL